ncbi:MAG: type II secretion system protein [Patescibacteria group bacterium]
MNKFLKQINNKKNNQKKGFTLVETLVALSIFLVSIVGIMSVLASGLTNINQAKKKMTATFLAQEGIEYMRNIRDTNVLYSIDGWSDFLTETTNSGCTTNDGCDINNNLLIIPCSSGCPILLSSFNRTIKIELNNLNSEEVKVFSTVFWNQGNSTKSVTLSESLFNWTK